MFVPTFPENMQLQKHQQMFLTQQQIALRHESDCRSSPSMWSLPSRLALLRDVKVELQNRMLWQKFYPENTEMIITKSGSGAYLQMNKRDQPFSSPLQDLGASKRRMFPSIQLTVNGLKTRESYYILLEMKPTSNSRYKYCGNVGGDDDENGDKSNIEGWSFAGPAEPQPCFDRRVYVHPDSPAIGEHWMQNVINFSKLKLTNNIVDHRNNVVLTSMHKYIPTIWIIQCAKTNGLSDLFHYPAASFVFKETEFIAVTAYQNENITKLKIDNNPFAKGFRETGQSRYRRKHQQIDLQLFNQIDDEYSNQEDDNSSKFEINNSAKMSLDLNLPQNSKRQKSETGCSHGDTVSKESPSTAEQNREVNIPSCFYRPWLNSSFPNRTMPSLSPRISSWPLTVYNWPPYYSQAPYITQENFIGFQ